MQINPVAGCIFATCNTLDICADTWHTWYICAAHLCSSVRLNSARVCLASRGVTERQKPAESWRSSTALSAPPSLWHAERKSSNSPSLKDAQHERQTQLSKKNTWASSPVGFFNSHILSEHFILIGCRSRVSLSKNRQTLSIWAHWYWLALQADSKLTIVVRAISRCCSWLISLQFTNTYHQVYLSGTLCVHWRLLMWENLNFFFMFADQVTYWGTMLRDLETCSMSLHRHTTVTVNHHLASTNKHTNKTDWHLPGLLGLVCSQQQGGDVWEGRGGPL